MNDAESIVELIPRLRRYARALAGERTAADDLVQDTLERAWSKLHLYRRGTDLRAWLFTVMHNVYVNQRRAARPSTPLDDEMQELAQPVRETDTLVLRDLDAAIRRLPPEQREVLLLVALEDMSYAEAAEALEIPIGTVMSRLARAREKLRAMLSGLPPGGGAQLKIVK
jgi:RNA polymerase sigma-70 factor (ECF subfamily)